MTGWHVQIGGIATPTPVPRLVVLRPSPVPSAITGNSSNSSIGERVSNLFNATKPKPLGRSRKPWGRGADRPKGPQLYSNLKIEEQQLSILQNQISALAPPLKVDNGQAHNESNQTEFPPAKLVLLGGPHRMAAFQDSSRYEHIRPTEGLPPSSLHR